MQINHGTEPKLVTGNYITKFGYYKARAAMHKAGQQIATRPVLFTQRMGTQTHPYDLFFLLWQNSEHQAIAAPVNFGEVELLRGGRDNVVLTLQT